MVVVLFRRHLEKVEMSDEFCLNDNSICRPRKHNNPLKYRSHTTIRAKMKLLPVFGCHLEFRVKVSSVKVGMVTVEMRTLENMGMAFGILCLGGTEPEIHWG